jgi:hypothetical protein
MCYITTYPDPLQLKGKTMVAVNEETLVRQIRLSLWTVMALVVLLGAAASLVAIGPESEAATIGTRLFMALPVVIIIACSALMSGNRGGPSAKAMMQRILGDELRQQSLGRAYRNGFFAMLACQGPLVATAMLAPVESGPILQACLTATIGLVTALASVLWYDR